MPLETATYISDLDPTNPVGSSDLVSSLDDHMRLVKATLKNTFPNIDGMVSATEDELNHLDGVTGKTGTGKLVLDASPTIANLTVTGSIALPAKSIADAALSDNVPLKNAQNTFIGEIIFTQDVTSARSLPQYRWIETSAAENNRLWVAFAENGTLFLRAFNDAATSSNTAIAIGRSGTTISSISLTASSITLNGVNVADYVRKSQENTFLGTMQTISAANANWLATNGAVAVKIQALNANNTGTVGTESNHELHFITNNTSRGSVRTDGSFHLPTVATSTSTTLVAGQVHAITSNASLPNMAAGQWVGVINNSASPVTITKNASDTMYWTATGVSVTSVTVSPRGKATFFCADGTNVYASGNIIGSS